MAEMQSKMNDFRPQITAETDQKIRKARLFGEGGGSEKMDAVRLVIEKSMSQRVERVQEQVYEEMVAMEDRITKQKREYNLSESPQTIKSRSVLDTMQHQKIKDLESFVTELRSKQADTNNRLKVASEDNLVLVAENREIRQDVMIKLEDLESQFNGRCSLQDDKIKRFSSQKELYKAKVERDMEEFREKLANLQYQLDGEQQKLPPSPGAPVKDIRALKGEIARVETSFLTFKESQIRKNEETDLELHSLSTTEPNLQDVESRIVSRCQDHTRQSVQSEALKREQIVSKMHMLENRLKDSQISMTQIQAAEEMSKQKINENERRGEENARLIQEARREAAMASANLKAKDYDGKIALLNSESGNHKTSLVQHEQDIAEIRTLLELKDNHTVLETSSAAPRDSKALQQVITMLNQQKATTDRHQQQLGALKDVGSRLDSLEDSQLALLSLPGRVESLESLKKDVADLKATVLAHEREAKLERRTISEHLKNFETENRIEHDGFNKRFASLQGMLSSTLQLQSRLEIIETDNTDLKRKIKQCQEYIAEVERHCKHGRQLTEKKIREIEQFIDRTMQQTNEQLDSNMQQFEHVIYDIDERLQRLEKQETQIKKKQQVANRRLFELDTFLKRKEGEPTVATVTKVERYARTPVQESSFSQDVQARLIEEEYEESDQDVDIDDAADERVHAGTPQEGISTKSIQSLPQANIPTDPGSRYTFQMVKFHSPIRYLRKAGQPIDTEKSIDGYNYLLPDRKSSTKPSWSERMFRRSEQFDPEQALGINLANKREDNLPSERKSYVDPLHTQSRSVIVEKNYKVENEDEMKDILRSEIGDMLVIKDSQSKAEKEGEEADLQNTNRSVSPVDYLRPLDHQSEIMHSFLQSSQNPTQLSFRSSRTPSPTAIVMKSQHLQKSRFRSKEENMEGSAMNGIVIKSQKILTMDLENRVWHEIRQKKSRQNSQKYYMNMLVKAQEKVKGPPSARGQVSARGQPPSMGTGRNSSPTSKIQAPSHLFANDFKIQPYKQHPETNTPSYSGRVVSATSKLTTPSNEQSPEDHALEILDDRAVRDQGDSFDLIKQTNTRMSSEIPSGEPLKIGDLSIRSLKVPGKII